MSVFRCCVGALATAALLSGCATVRQSDLDAWVGVPVQALDTHPLFLTMPQYRTQTANGVDSQLFQQQRRGTVLAGGHASALAA